MRYILIRDHPPTPIGRGDSRLEKDNLVVQRLSRLATSDINRFFELTSKIKGMLLPPVRKIPGYCCFVLACLASIGQQAAIAPDSNKSHALIAPKYVLPNLS